jgi:WD40 repeat protein
VLDSSGSYIAVSGQDKIVRIREVSTSNVVAKANVGDTITGITFSYNNKHLITASNDGCMMIWRIPPEIKNNIERKKHQLGQITKRLKELFRA